MSDPITDFIKSQVDDAPTDYDPIAGFRRNLDLATGAKTPRGIQDGEVGQDLIQSAEQYTFPGIVKTGYRKGLKQAGADVSYMKGAFKALVGDENGARKAVEQGVKQANEASKVVGALDMAEEWEELLEEPSFEEFMEFAPAVIGEVGFSALTSITGALIGVGIAAYTSPATVPVGTAAVLAGAGGKKTLQKITKQLAFKEFTEQTIATAVKKAALRKTLTAKEKDVMTAVYGQFQKNMLAKRKKRGAIAGTIASEFPRSTGSAFSNYASEDMYDPVSAALSIGQGVASAVVGGATEGVVLNSLVKAFTKSTAFKSIATPAGKNYIAPSVGKQASKALGLSLVGEPVTEVLQSGIESAQKLGMLDPRLDGQLDKTFTAQQARLDAQMSAAAGLIAGGAFGSGGAISVGATTGAQNLLREYQQRTALISMIQNKYGPSGQGVQIEPKEWIKGQFNALLDPEADKEAVWIDVNSLDELAKYKEENPGAAKMLEVMSSYDMTDADTQLGGILFSTNPEVIQSFKQVMENNMPSAALLDGQLARVLKYPRTRSNADEWVVQVRDKDTGALVHYHQTGDPKEDGGVHLEEVKKMFPNANKYSYEIVDGETHLDERQTLVDTPAVDLSSIKKMGMLSEEEAAEMMGKTAVDFEGATGLRDETGKFAQVGEVVEDAVEVTPVIQKDQAPIMDRNNRPWTKPNLQYRDDQVPNAELQKNARLVTHPAFRAEFDENIKNNNYSRLLLKKFITQANKFAEVDTESNTELVYKIDPEGQGFVIKKYEKPLEKLQTYEQAKPEFDRAIIEAKGKGRKKRTKVFNDGTSRVVFMDSPFQITTRDPDGKFTLPQTVDMPTLVNKYKKILGRMGTLPNEQYYQSLADTFTSVYGSIIEDPDYELTFKGEPITDKSFNDPEFVVYTEENGKREFTFSDLLAKGAEQSMGISEQDPTNTVKNLEKRITEKQKEITSLEDQIKELQTQREQQGQFSPEQYNQFMELVEALYGPKKGQKRNTSANLYIQRNDLEQSLREAEVAGGSTTLDPRADIDETTDTSSREEGIFQNQNSREQFWNEEFEHYQKQGFTRSKIGTKQETKTVNEPVMPKKTEGIILSDALDKATPESVKAYFREVGKIAKQHIGLKRPILLYTQQEDIDIGKTAEALPEAKRVIQDYSPDDYDLGVKNVNAKLNQIKNEVMQDQMGVAGYLQGMGGAFDILVLKTPENLTEFDFGLLHLVLGHELGHSFFKQEMNNILKNPIIRRHFMKEFEKAKENSPEVAQYFDVNGFEEWFVDKVGAGLFDLEKGTIPTSKNLSDNFIKTMVKGLKAFYDAKANIESGIVPGTDTATFFQGRFRYDETVGEFMKGISGTMEARTNINFQDRAHAEELIDSLFGNKMGISFLRKINKDAEGMFKSGKVPSWFTKLFYTARGFLDTLGKDQGIGKEIGQMFHKVSGEQGDPGLINESNRKLNEIVNDLVKRLDMDGKDVDGFDAIVQGVTGVNDNAFSQEEIDAFREAQDEKKPTEALSPKAQIIRKFLFDMYDVLELDKYKINSYDIKTGQFVEKEISRRANFFPRIILVADIASDAKLKASLIEELVKANPNIAVSAIEKSVETIIKNNEKNVDVATKKDESSGLGVGMPIPRAILFENLSTPTLVEKGLAAPGEVAILEYLRDITRQVELQKRGGSRKIKKLILQLPLEEQGHAVDAVNAMLGRIDPIRYSAWRHINDGVLLTNVVTLLGMAVFASVPDAAGPVLRSRTFELKAIAKNITAAMGKGEAEQFARNIGSNGREAMASTILYAGELDSASLWMKKATNGWFRITQLERWTVFTRKFAAGMARDFLLKHAEIVEKGYEGDADVLLSERYLKDLGLTGKEIKAWKDSGSNVDAHPKVATALGRFVDESIVRPNAAERPIWASDPHWAIVWQLKSFYYAYGKNIMGGMFREGNTRYAETGNITPAIMPLFFGAALLMPLTMLGWDIRERFKIGLSYALPGVSPNDPGVNYRASKNMSNGDYWFEVLDRSGMMGAPALALPLIMEDKRYGKPALIPILGPGAERVYDAVTGEAKALDYAPVYSQLDTRALER